MSGLKLLLHTGLSGNISLIGLKSEKGVGKNLEVTDQGSVLLWREEVSSVHRGLGAAGSDTHARHCNPYKKQPTLDLICPLSSCALITSEPATFHVAPNELRWSEEQG